MCKSRTHNIQHFFSKELPTFTATIIIDKQVKSFAELKVLKRNF